MKSKIPVEGRKGLTSKKLGGLEVPEDSYWPSHNKSSQKDRKDQDRHLDMEDHWIWRRRPVAMKICPKNN